MDIFYRTTRPIHRRCLKKLFKLILKETVSKSQKRYFHQSWPNNHTFHKVLPTLLESLQFLLEMYALVYFCQLVCLSASLRSTWGSKPSNARNCMAVSKTREVIKEKQIGKENSLLNTCEKKIKNDLKFRLGRCSEINQLKIILNAAVLKKLYT